MAKRDKANYLIQSVSHAFDVLEAISSSGGEIGVTELSRKVKLHKNNVFRILATLELRSYVEQNSRTENYRLGIKNLELGKAYLNHTELLSIARPTLEDLSSQSGETASLAFLRNGYLQYPLSIEPVKPVRVVGREASNTPARNSATGRLLLSGLPDSQLAELVPEKDSALSKHLLDLSETGRVIDKGALEADVLVVASEVRNLDDTVLGAIEIAAPLYRAKAENLEKLVIAACKELSERMGAATKETTAPQTLDSKVTIEREKVGIRG